MIQVVDKHPAERVEGGGDDLDNLGHEHAFLFGEGGVSPKQLSKVREKLHLHCDGGGIPALLHNSPGVFVPSLDFRCYFLDWLALSLP